MTIKQWIYKHVNITFAFLLLLVILWWGMTLNSIDDRAWGYAILYGFFTLVSLNSIIVWWRDRL